MESEISIWNRTDIWVVPRIVNLELRKHVLRNSDTWVCVLNGGLLSLR